MAKAGDRIVEINKLRLESAPPVSVSNVHVMRLPYLEACEVISRQAVTSSVHQLLLLAAAADTTASRRGRGDRRIQPIMLGGPRLLFRVRGESSRKLIVLLYTAIFAKNMTNSTLNYLIPDWSTAVT